MPFPLWRSQAGAALFSLKIKVGGAELNTFGDVTVTRAVSGIGTSGLCTSQLTFTCPAPLSAYRAAVVEVVGVDLPKYYIDSRTAKDGTVSVTALDRMAYTDKDFDIGWVDVDSGDRVQTSAVLGVIAIKCGFAGYAAVIPDWLGSLPKAMVGGVSCATILENLSTVMCGFWYTSNGNELAFLSYGTASGNMPVSEHSALAIGDEYTAQGVRVTNGSSVYERGSTMYDYDTLQISSELAVDDTAADIWGNAEGKAYDAVSCSDCVLTFIPFPGCDVTFGQFPSRSYRIMSVTAKLSSGGIMGSLTTSAPSGGEISRRGRLTRTVNGKVTEGGRYGNSRITSDGIIFEEE